MVIDGKTIHQIGIPFQWGYAGETVGSMANDLSSLVADPNVSMHEAKVFVCRVRAGRADKPADGADEARGPLGQSRPGSRHARRGAAGRPFGQKMRKMGRRITPPDDGPAESKATHHDCNLKCLAKP